MNQRYFYPVLALLILVAALGAACDGSESPETDSGATPAQIDAPKAAYELLLGAIPDSTQARDRVFINDYDLVRRMFDIPLPGPGDDDDTLEAFYNRIPPLVYDPDNPTPVLQFGGFSFFSPYNPFAFIRDNLQNLAFDVRNTDQSIVAGHGKQIKMDVVRGRFDPEATDKALGTCSQCPPPGRHEHRGIHFYSWGEDYAEDPAIRFAPPAFDRLGRGGRVAVLDEYVFHTFGTSEMKALIDARLNEMPSLAGVEEFRLLADGMSQLGAYVMLLTDGSNGYDMSLEAIAKSLFRDGDGIPTQSVSEKQKRSLAEAGGPLLRPFGAYATGAGIDEDGPYMALAIVHSDDGSAEKNVGLLRSKIEEGTSVFAGEQWSEYINTDTSEIRAEGRVLTAKLRGDIFHSWIRWLNNRDSHA